MAISETIIISIISASVASYLAYFFGFRQYLKQRAREEINAYYIKDGIDKIITAIDEASFNCQFNFGKAIRILEYLEKFSEIDKELTKTLISKLFSEMQPMVVATPDALYKLQLLIGEQYKPFCPWIIETLADYLNYNHYLRYELLGEIELYFRFPERFKGKKERFTKTLENRVVKINKEVIFNNEPLKIHLLNLKIRVDEIGISTIKDFDKKIPKDKRIKEILGEVERDYKKFKNQNARNKITI